MDVRNTILLLLFIASGVLSYLAYSVSWSPISVWVMEKYHSSKRHKKIIYISLGVAAGSFAIAIIFGMYYIEYANIRFGFGLYVVGLVGILIVEGIIHAIQMDEFRNKENCTMGND